MRHWAGIERLKPEDTKEISLEISFKSQEFPQECEDWQADAQLMFVLVPWPFLCGM